MGILFAEVFNCWWYLIAIDSDISLYLFPSKFGIADESSKSGHRLHGVTPRAIKYIQTQSARAQR
jgi:hypothetical protein